LIIAHRDKKCVNDGTSLEEKLLTAEIAENSAENAERINSTSVLTAAPRDSGIVFLCDLCAVLGVLCS
jgi:hypothetical protein